MKEFNWIRCQEVGIQYKKLVKSYGQFTYGRTRLFIHKSIAGDGLYSISDIDSGILIITGLRKPSIPAARVYLSRNLTPEQDKVLDLYPSQKLLKAYHRKSLDLLPNKKEVEDQILRRLEEIIISGNPF